jgi:hypothetical protein
MEGDSPVFGQSAFMPWLSLAKSQSVAGVSFVPFMTANGDPSAELSDVAEPLRAIFASYIDRKGKAIRNCVVAVVPNSGWNVRDADFDRVQWAATLLFLACWAANDYFPRFFGPYSNSSSFRLVWQRFGGDPVWVSLVSRRRDGRTIDGGYKHGEVKFSAPLQCRFQDAALIDEGLLAALEADESCVTMGRLHGALPFVALANTDDDLITGGAEAILMGSAFEQLLRGDASAYKLGRTFGGWFRRFGSVTVEQARLSRPGIEIDTSRPEYATAQPKWYVHRKWMEELYDLRTQSVHKGTTHGRTWGWSVEEHLVMAAWVFPLVVKVLLESEGHYKLTEDDVGHCLAVDKFLSITGWGEEANNGPTRWHDVVSKTIRDYKFDQVMKRYLEQHPGLFPPRES